MTDQPDARWRDLASDLDAWAKRIDAEPSAVLRPGQTFDPAAVSGAAAKTPAGAFGQALPVLMNAYRAADAPVGDMVRLARVARHFGYHHAARAMLIAAMTRKPVDLGAYREYWLQISVTGAVADEATTRGRLCTYLIGEVRARLNALGARYYAISFHESGFGDQMMTASVSAKLAEVLGLHFIGVVDEHAAKQGRIGVLFDGGKSWFDIVFGDELPMIARRDCREIGLQYGELHGLLGQLLRDLEAMTQPFETVTFRMGAQNAALLQPLMWDRRGGLLHNGFTTYVREAANVTIKRVNLLRATCRARVALHLRIGDVVNIPLISPGCFLIPHAVQGFRIHVETVAEADMPTHTRASRVPFFLALAEACRATFRNEVMLDIATDGYARILASLEREEFVKQLAEAAGHGFDVAAVRAHFVEQDTLLRTRMSALGALHYGEQANTFKDSIRAIKSADVIVTTSGQFAPSIANFLSEADHAQTVFTFHRDVRFLLNRPGVALSYLGRDAAANMKTILDTIMAVDGRSAFGS